MKIGLYVGSFNPVHKGHIKITKTLLKKRIIDKALIVPTMNYWDKNNLIDINDRINMLKTYENKNIIIDTKRNQYEYTYQIIEDLKKEYKIDEIYLIIGADNLEKFHLWKNITEILKNNIIVINRNNLETKKYIDNFKEKNNFIVVNDIKPINISSTEIRNCIKNNEKLNKYIDLPVIEYIKQRKLYGDENDKN